MKWHSALYCSKTSLGLPRFCSDCCLYTDPSASLFLECLTFKFRYVRLKIILNVLNPHCNDIFSWWPHNRFYVAMITSWPLYLLKPERVTAISDKIHFPQCSLPAYSAVKPFLSTLPPASRQKGAVLGILVGLSHLTFEKGLIACINAFLEMLFLRFAHGACHILKDSVVHPAQEQGFYISLSFRFICA